MLKVFGKGTRDLRAVKVRTCLYEAIIRPIFVREFRYHFP